MNLIATSQGLARLDDDGAVLLDLPFADVAEMLAAGEGFAPAHAARERDRIPLGELRPPLGSTGAIWGVGLNYLSKARLTGRSVPSAPILFLRSPSAVSAPGAEVPLPQDRSSQVDYEGEVAFVIGRPMLRTPPGEVWDHIAGITAANDMTARDVMVATATPTLAKSFPGFGALGASVLELSAVDDPERIAVRTSVNGTVRQDSSTAELIFAVPELISRISHFAALRPGDVVLTGTPAGTGQDRGVFLCPGDEVEVSVAGVLPLCTRYR
ncbi:fumarylacetoacetate hydrolase family protein [Streptosporangium sp. NBC_01810]|uniref:fumarylacetoacetate hydrolase family protein n=1 Tax=Streptosporangium sp. NBC_01810 TaxID=2975951 RepID=UPI002DD7E354|nr:fumarylacetoacetate hydrolase family protein [Streptosporangium sp. NBC_01810]WSA24901.1 fumarylacetoacetate hydrolase family protein [Streptosporangium sp. NBC_01810]